MRSVYCSALTRVGPSMHLSGDVPGIKLHRVEEEGIIEPQHRGLVLITVGKVLLWMDFLLLAFVYVGLRSGSHMWLWWVLGEGILGLILLEVGMHQRGSLTK